MKVLIAPNAFKGTISASDAAEIIGQIVASKYPNSQVKKIPIADGGDGTCELLTEYLELEKISTWSLDPFGRPAFGSFGYDFRSKTIYLDVSTVSGIGLLDSSELNPRVASTFGTGKLIQKGIEMGAEHVILGLGGSASIDLGLGILQGLGFVFLDSLGKEIVPFSDHLLKKLAYVQSKPKLSKLTFTCLCDVRNTFFGATGAIPVFGPQKGLSSDQMDSFSEDANRIIQLLYQKAKKPFEDCTGFGAAGGIALGLNAFFSTEIKFGASYFFDQVAMENEVQSSDVVVTGEGRFDQQSKEGKGCFELLQICKKYQKPCYLVTSGEEGQDIGFESVMKLPELDFSRIDYKKKAAENLKLTLEKKLTI
ncbi:glycerate kinase family protein [Algoriphagus formosus]|uniref:glycerate kinase family protein n=1 Tax=Algoriphagus formosus TaxID=2007308 RepID=UPI000C28D51C|nr:glycerate kinase [Algoriphagus formosus]